MAPRVCDKCGEWLTLHDISVHKCKPEFLREMRLRKEAEMEIQGQGIRGRLDEVVWAWCLEHCPEKTIPEIWYSDNGIYDAIEVMLERINE